MAAGRERTSCKVAVGLGRAVGLAASLCRVSPAVPTEGRQSDPAGLNFGGPKEERCLSCTSICSFDCGRASGASGSAISKATTTATCSCMTGAGLAAGACGTDCHLDSCAATTAAGRTATFPERIRRRSAASRGRGITGTSASKGASSAN